MSVSMETINHLVETFKVIGPFVTAIIALIVWAWRRMEKAQDRLEQALTDHINADDDVHDNIFTLSRQTDAKLNRLIGEHEVQHRR